VPGAAIVTNGSGAPVTPAAPATPPAVSPTPDTAAPVTPTVAPSEVVAPAAPPSVLSGEPKADAAPAPAPTGTPAAEPAPAPADAPTIEEPVAPTYEFAFPEDRPADPDLLKGATELFATDRLTQEQAQRYVDYTNDTVIPRLRDRLMNELTEGWNATKAQWAKDFEADPVIGGNRRDTTVNEGRFAITDLTRGDEKTKKEFWELQNASGNGNHIASLRIFSEAGRRFQQIYDLTHTNNWADAMKRLKEAPARQPALPARASGGPQRAADRRYGTPSNSRNI
jgi:hypothetical protein